MKCSLFLALIVVGAVRGDAIPHIGRIKSALDSPVAKVKEAMIQEVRMADIRLLRKDGNRKSDSHPILSASHIDVRRARVMFQTGWDKLYAWANDLNSDYTSVHEAHRLFYSNHYNSSMDTLLIMHDSCGNARDSNMIKVIEALKLRNFDANYNIMMLDFKKLMCEDISSSIGLQRGFFKIGFNPQLQLLGIEIGNFLYKGISKGKLRAGQMNLVGLGISTHLAGIVAKRTRKLCGEKLSSILGLDPPVSLRKSHLVKGGARHIHIYHTFHLVPGTGLLTTHAKTDFIFGGAKRGPVCKKSITTGCFQEFGVQLFVSTLLFPDMFPARWCPDYQKFSEHFCDNNDYMFVSFPPNNSTGGAYQMDINYEFPFGRGFDGIYEKEEVAEDDLAALGSDEVAKMSVQDYHIRLQKEVSRIRFDIMSCMHGVMTPTAFMRCVMTTVPTVKRLVKQKLIIKLGCEPFEKSPTGQKCRYETRTHIAFELPF